MGEQEKVAYLRSAKQIYNLRSRKARPGSLRASGQAGMTTLNSTRRDSGSRAGRASPAPTKGNGHGEILRLRERRSAQDDSIEATAKVKRRRVPAAPESAERTAALQRGESPHYRMRIKVAGAKKKRYGPGRASFRKGWSRQALAAFRCGTIRARLDCAAGTRAA
jgi:hypothetical protein